MHGDFVDEVFCFVFHLFSRCLSLLQSHPFFFCFLFFFSHTTGPGHDPGAQPRVLQDVHCGDCVAGQRRVAAAAGRAAVGRGRAAAAGPLLRHGGLSAARDAGAHW